MLYLSANVGHVRCACSLMDQYKIESVNHPLYSFYHLAEHKEYRSFLSRLPFNQLLGLCA